MGDSGPLLCIPRAQSTMRSSLEAPFPEAPLIELHILFVVRFVREKGRQPIGTMMHLNRSESAMVVCGMWDEGRGCGTQIARIGASTTVAPAGLYSAADDGSISKAEDYAPKQWSELTDLESWVHIRSHLKKQGASLAPSHSYRC